MSNIDLYTYAALSEHIYRRDVTRDQALTLDDIGVSGIQASDGLTVTGRSVEDLGSLSTDGDYYYSSRGFVGTIVNHNGKIVVVLRGTDSNVSGWSSTQLAIINEDGVPGDGSDIDLGDAETNYELGLGSFDATQWDDTRALMAKAIELAEGNLDNVVVTGQSLGGGVGEPCFLDFWRSGLCICVRPI